jgi:hypothetical protein
MMRQSGHTKTRPHLIWAAGLVAAMITLLVPFLMTDVPAVLDYPNHLARFVILAQPDDPVLSRIYAPHWRVLPNLGMDVLGALLCSVLPPYQAGRILLAIALLAPTIGTAIYARLAFGRWTWWSFCAAVIAYNGVFILGFMNYLLSLGVALAGAGLWRHCRQNASVRVTAVLGLLAGGLAFFCHLLGFAFFALLIGADEAHQLWRLRQTGLLGRQTILSSAALLGGTIGPLLVVYWVTHQAAVGGDPLQWRWAAKPLLLAMPFMSYDTLVTQITLAIMVGLGSVIWFHSHKASGVALGLALITLAGIFGPFAIAGGTFLDQRLSLMAALLVFAGLNPNVSSRAGMEILSIIGAVLIVRSIDIAGTWVGRDKDLASYRAAFSQIPSGARVLSVTADHRAPDHSGRGRVLHSVIWLDEHLGALVVIERRAFWSSLFADQNQQPLMVQPAYAALALPLNHQVEWRGLFRPEVRVRPALRDWRNHYDFVLVRGYTATTARIPAHLRLLYARDGVALFRVV